MIDIKAVLMDRGFFRAVTVDILYRYGIPFIIRVIRTKRINKFLEEFKENKRTWYVYVYEINKTAYGKSDRRVIQIKTTLVILDNSMVEKMPAEKYDDDRYFIFITNLPVFSQEIAFQIARDFR